VNQENQSDMQGSGMTKVSTGKARSLLLNRS